MKSAMSLSIVLLWVGVSLQPILGSQGKTPNVPNRLLGAWRLVSLEETGANGHVQCGL